MRKKSLLGLVPISIDIVEELAPPSAQIKKDSIIQSPSICFSRGVMVKIQSTSIREISDT